MQGQVHHLADLHGLSLGEGAAKDGKVLSVDTDPASVNLAVASHHAVAQNLLLSHAEIGGAVGDERINLLESAFIEQQGQPFAGRQLALGVLSLDALCSSAETGFLS